MPQLLLSHIDDLQKELKASKANVEMMNMVKQYWANLCTDLRRSSVSDYVRLEKQAKAHEAEDREGKLEAEVERLKAQLESTQSLRDAYRTLACSRISEIRDLKAEVERLQSQLKRAIEIAEDIKKGGEIALQVIRESGRWAFEPHDGPRADIKQGIEKLNAFKAEIK